MYRPIDELEEGLKKDALQEAVDRNTAKLAAASAVKPTAIPSKSPYGTEYPTELLPPDNSAEAWRNAQANAEALIAQDAQTWEKSYEKGTALGFAKNSGANFMNSLSKGVVAALYEMPTRAIAELQLQDISDEAQTAYIKEKELEQARTSKMWLDKGLLTGSITKEQYDAESAKLDQVIEASRLSEAEAALLEGGAGYMNSTTVRERLNSIGSLQEFYQSRKQAREEEFGSLVNGSRLGEVTDEIKEAAQQGWSAPEAKALRDRGVEKIQQGDYLDGASDLIEGIWDGGIDGLTQGVQPLIDNPTAILDLAAEAVGEAGLFAFGAPGVALSVGESISEGFDAVDRGIAEREKDLGRRLYNDERARILAAGGAYSGLDLVGDAVLGGVLTKALPNSLKRNDAKTVESRTVDAEGNVGSTTYTDVDVADIGSPQSVAAALRDSLGMRTVERAGAIASTAAKEAVIGGTQSVMESTVLQDRYDTEKVEAGEVLRDALLEGVAGGSLSAGIGAAGTAKDVVKEVKNISVDVLKSKFSASQLDKDQKNLSPEQRSAAETASASAVETGDFSSVNDEDSPLFDMLTSLSTIASRNALGEVSQEEKDRNVDLANTLIAKVGEQNAVLMNTLEALQGKNDPESTAEYGRIANEIKINYQRLQEAQTLIQQITSGSAVNAETADALKETVNTSTELTEDSVAQGEQLIKLAQMTPGYVTSDEAIQLAQSPGLNESQKTYLTQYAEAQRAIDEAKDIKSVSKDIFVGGEGFRGLDQYRAQLPSLLRTSKADSAVKLVKELQKFAEGKVQRANDFSAYMSVITDPRATDAQRLRAKQAFDEKGYTTRQGKPYTLANTRGSAALVDAMTAEATAITSTLNESMALLNNSLVKGEVTAEQVQATGLSPVANATAQPTPSPANTAQTGNQGTAATVISEPPNAREGVPTASESQMSEYEQMMNGDVAATTTPTESVTPVQESVQGTPSVTETSTPTLTVRENTQSGYRSRTISNVMNSDVTIAYAADHTTPGERLTANAARNSNRPFVKNEGKTAEQFVAETVTALNNVKGKVLNIAGNGIYTWADSNVSQEQLNQEMYDFLKAVKAQYPALTTVVSGGQTGTDFAGLVAAKALGLNVDAQLPKGFVQRGIDGKDRKRSAATIEDAINRGAQTLLEQQQDVENASPPAPTQEAPPDPVEDVTEPEAATNDPVTETPNENAPTTEIANEVSDNSVATDGNLVTIRGDLASGLVSFGRKIAGKFGLTKRKTNLENEGLLSTVSFSEVVDSIAPDSPEYELVKLHQELRGVFDQLFDQDNEYLALLADNDGNVDENVKAAFTVTAFNWLTGTGMTTLYNDDKAINGIVGRLNDAPVTNEMRELLMDIGTTKNVLADDLGRDIARVLGVKFGEDAYGNLQGNFESSLGGFAIQMLLGARYLTLGEKSGQDIVNTLPLWEQDESSWNGVPNVQFIRLQAEHALRKKRDGGRFRPAPRIAQMRSADRAVEGGITQLFARTLQKSLPSLAPVTEVAQKMRGTDQELPGFMKDAIRKAQARPFRLKQDLGNVLSQLGKQNTLQIFGFVHNANAITQVDRLKGVEGNNSAIERSLESYTDMLNTAGYETPFFFKYFMARQGRLHIDSTGFNPQSDKAHRFLMTSDDFVATVSTDKNSASYQSYRLSVAEAFGIKVDQLTPEESLRQLDAKLEANPVIAEAATLMAAMANGETVAPDASTKIMAALSATEMNTHGLSGLMSLGKELTAEGGTFTHDLVAEVDGKTNGLAIGMLQLAGWAPGAARKTLAKFGLFFDGTQSYGEWYAQPGSLDAYQELAVDWSEALTDEAIRASLDRRIAVAKEKKQWNTAKRLEKRWSQIGDLKSFVREFMDENGDVTKDGRNLSKYPTMMTAYGGSIKAISNNVADAVLEKIRNEIERIHNDSQLSLDQKRSQTSYYVRRLEAITGQRQGAFTRDTSEYDAKDGKWYYSSSKAMNFSIDKKLEAEIRGVINDTYSYAAEGAILEIYGQFNTNRGLLNEIVDETNTLYVQLYNEMVEFQTQLLEKADPDFDRTKHELPRSTINKIKKQMERALPSMRQPMQLESEDATKSIALTKEERVRGTDEAHKVTLKNGMPIVNHSGAVVDRMPKSFTSSVRTLSQNLGVRSAVMSIHNMDASVAIQALNDFNVISVFDGFLGNTNDMDAITNRLNEAFITDAKNHSLLLNALQNLKDMQTHYLSLTRTEPEKLETVRTRFANDLNEFESLVQTIESERQGVIEQITDVLQYNREGANANYRTGVEPTIEDVEAAVEADMERLREEIEEPTSPWGALGRDASWYNKYRPEQAILNLFKDRDMVTGQEVLDVLAKRLSAKNRTKHAKGLGVLASLLGKTLGDIEVHILRRDTDIPPEHMPPKQWNNNFAAYASGNRVYLKDTDFMIHGFDSSSILHELVHSATMAKLRDPKFKQQMESLVQLKRFAEVELMSRGWKDHPAFAESKDGFEIDEFVAWAMTDEAFQRALAGLKLPKDWGGTFKDAFDAFVHAVADILGLSKEGVDYSVLTQVLQNTYEVIDGNEDAPPFELQTPPMPQQAPNDYSNEQLFHALGQSGGRAVSASEKARLAKLLSSFSGRISLFDAYVKDAAHDLKDVTDLYIQSLQQGRNPFVSKLKTVGLNLTKQELYVAEQVEAITRAGMATTPRVHKELRALFKKAKDQLPLSAFHRDPMMAEMIRDNVFRIDATDENGRSDYLARFLALSQTHKPLRDALEKLSSEPRTDGTQGTLAYQLDKFFNKVMDTINQLLNLERKDKNLQGRLDQMFTELADTRVVNQSQAVQNMLDRVEKLEGVANSLAGAIRNTIDKTVRSDAIAKSKNSLVRATGYAVRGLTNNTVDQHIKGMEDLLAPYRKGKQGVIGNLITELKQITPDTVKFYELLRIAKHRIDQGRKHIESYTTKAVVRAFARPLTEQESESLTKAVIKTDLAALVGSYSLADIDKLMVDNDYREQEIQRLRNRLRATGNLSMRLRQDARNLGWFMATGKVAENQMFNAHTIARQLGRGTSVNTDVTAIAEPLVDQLATLWAIEYTHEDHRKAVSELIREESARDTGENGIEFLINSHAALKKMSLRDLFEDNPVMMIKGYTKDTTDPHVTLKVVDDETDIDLQRRGYQKVRDLGRDVHDVYRQTAKLMVSEQDGLNTHVTGIISLSGRKSKGSRLEWMSKRDVDTVSRSRLSTLDRNPRAERDPADDKRTHMAPVYRPDGAVVNYRYMMNEAERDSLLRRNNDIGKVMGVYAASIVDKNETKSMNAETVQALAADFRENQANLGQYIMIGREATDPKLREAWDLLPKETQLEAQRAFGGKRMFIRRDMENIVLGYRKMGMLTDLWDIPEEERNFLQQAVIDGLEALLGTGALGKVRRNGEIWDELIRGVKDIFVIRTGVVLAGNIISNFSVLHMAGVPIKDMIKHHRDGYNGIVAYQKDLEEIGILKQQLDGNTQLSRQKRREMEERVAELEDAVAVNPVRELAEAGAFTTIIEDLDDMPDEYTYRNKLDSWIEERTKSVPQPIKTATNWALINKETAAYKVLNHGTQVSDFVARYAMYKYLTETQAEPMAKRDAVNKVMGTFIMYDVPTDKWIQWGNDKGFFMFTKYFLRVQKVIYNLVREKPARALSIMALNNVFDFSNILDSSAIHIDPITYRVTNPVGLIMDAPQDILTFKLASEL